jgi:hypothetical protein
VLAHGITLDQMVELIRAGLATATAERVVGGKAIEVARVRIATAVPGLRTSSVRQWAARNTNKAPAGGRGFKEPTRNLEECLSLDAL